MSRTPKHRMRAIELSVHRAAKSAAWLEESDTATIRLAKRLAEVLDALYLAQADTLLPDARAEIASKTTYTAQTLLRTLEQLGLTAKSRDDLGYGTRPDEDDPLADIREAMADVIPLDATGD